MSAGIILISVGVLSIIFNVVGYTLEEVMIYGSQGIWCGILFEFCFGTRQRAHSWSNLATVNVAGCQIPLADHIKILGVTLDKNLSMNNHVYAVCKSVHYLMPRPFLCVWKHGQNGCVCCRWLSRVLFGTTQKKTSSNSRKHRTFLPMSLPVLNLLQQLHWLPIKHRIDYKIASITPYSSFFPTGLPAFILACLSFHSFPQTLQH